MEQSNPALQTQAKSSKPIQCSIGFDDDINNLLYNCTPKNTQIDLVARHYDAIIDARKRKITWDKIASTLNISRSTLINAVKALKIRRANSIVPSFVSTPIRRPVEDSSVNEGRHRQPIIPQNKTFIKQSTEPDSGLKVLGRAQIHNFNI
jgi:hypothetical protein